jgi:hypothetical protein
MAAGVVLSGTMPAFAGSHTSAKPAMGTAYTKLGAARAVSASHGAYAFNLDAVTGTPMRPTRRTT